MHAHYYQQRSFIRLSIHIYMDSIHYVISLKDNDDVWYIR